ncbi:hypothetical protein ACL02S_17975 [Nocardia sp. 004]|uniref:hypothetical protein n=1 Tax=Nocardia sp. 004 TaxID=3385978 RepID=UPI0039A0B9E5
MSVHVIDQGWIVSDQTPHQARRVNDDAWVVSYLRGRTVTTEQATAAIQAAELISLLQHLAGRIGLTGLELFGLVLIEAPWDITPTRYRSLLPRPGRWPRR